ncbi:hypothetical protein BP5796_09730 [Coleophoma crateriformis]|uniref:Uncharacterized protein n=1 Tax=Coleophoma crateriformis TaxID=565419 RepID=A0A3D8QZ93_9HELO|nr:hypothetical protein BP5796_09730 [Coleophoma crateriformis]
MAPKDVAYKQDNKKQTDSPSRIEPEVGAMIVRTTAEGGDGAESSRSKGKKKASRQASVPLAGTAMNGNNYTGLRAVNNSGMFNGDADGNSRNHKYNNIEVSYNSFAHNGNLGRAAMPGRHEHTHIGNIGSPAMPGGHEYGDLLASNGSTMVNGNAPVESLDQISSFMQRHRMRMAHTPEGSKRQH